MHLLTTTETVLKGFAYGLIIVWLTFSAFGFYIESDFLRVVLYAAAGIAYGFFGWQYVEAFKRRAYDRQYAAAKKQLWNALVAALPARGEIFFESGEVSVKLKRDKVLGPIDWFTIVLSEEGDSHYDEETMTKRVIKPYRYFQVHQKELFVSKDYFASIEHSTKHDTDDEGIDLATSIETTLDQTSKAIFKSKQKLPPDLLHASIDELYGLSGDIKNYMNGTAF